MIGKYDSSDMIITEIMSVTNIRCGDNFHQDSGMIKCTLWYSSYCEVAASKLDSLKVSEKFTCFSKC